MSISLNKLNKPGMNTSFGTNKTGKTGVTAQATKNMANYSGATNGSSIFKLNANHGSHWVPGVQVTPNQSRHNYQNVRQNMNSREFYGGSTGIGSRYYGAGTTQTVQAKQGMSGFEKAMMIGQLTNQGLATLNKILGSDKTAAPAAASASNTIDQNFGTDAAQTATATTFTGQLKGTTSFTQINAMESQVAQKKGALNNTKQDIGQESETNMNNILSANGVQAGLEAAGVTINSSSVSSLLTANFDGENYDTFLSAIDSDITQIQNFQTTELGQATAKVGEQIGIVSGQITSANNELGQLKLQLATATGDAKTALEGQIQAKERQIQELEAKQQQLNSAKEALEQVKTETQNTIDSLNDKKSDVKDIREFENKVKDKKYDLAKSQDKELGKTLEKLKKLEIEIQKASIDKNGKVYDKKDDKRNTKLAQLNSQKSALLSAMGNLVTSLSAAGGQGTSIANSKNQNYTISNLDKALAYQPATKTETES
ncbi:MAG: hypothetical protein NC191_06435 [Muribaculaceae bacterium]|nr:hypothetical protein [Muribaculaceae bacterium]